MKDKTSPRTKFWKVRVTEEEIKMRKQVAEIYEMTESELDRQMWQRQYETAMKMISKE